MSNKETNTIEDTVEFSNEETIVDVNISDIEIPNVETPGVKVPAGPQVPGTDMSTGIATQPDEEPKKESEDTKDANDPKENVSA